MNKMYIKSIEWSTDIFLMGTHLYTDTDTDLQTLLPLLEDVCRDHELGAQERETICMHRPKDNYGTVSSTILALSSDLHHSVYRYGNGSPCVEPYDEFSFLLQELL